MDRKQRGYLSYLVRLWQIMSSGGLVWRASLESPQTGSREGFAGLPDLFDYLEKQLGKVEASPPTAGANKGGGNDE